MARSLPPTTSMVFFHKDCSSDARRVFGKRAEDPDLCFHFTSYPFASIRFVIFLKKVENNLSTVPKECQDILTNMGVYPKLNEVQHKDKKIHGKE